MLLRPTVTTIIALALLAGCEGKPVTMERAKEICRESVREKTQPTGSIGISANSAGEVGSSFSLTIPVTSGDPEKMFRSCVISRSGSEPDQSYTEFAEKGHVNG